MWDGEIMIMRVTTLNSRGNVHEEVETDQLLPITNLDGYPPAWNITTLPVLGLYQKQGADALPHADTDHPAEFKTL